MTTERTPALVERLEAGEFSNELDVLIEVALFAPEARPNAAGTKVIYTNPDGSLSTHWAPDHCLHPAESIAALRTVAARQSTPPAPNKLGGDEAALEQRSAPLITPETNNEG